jgi:hypothetical protein
MGRRHHPSTHKTPTSTSQQARQAVLRCVRLSYVASNRRGSCETPFRHYIGHPKDAELMVKPTHEEPLGCARQAPEMGMAVHFRTFCPWACGRSRRLCVGANPEP